MYDVSKNPSKWAGTRPAICRAGLALSILFLGNAQAQVSQGGQVSIHVQPTQTHSSGDDVRVHYTVHNGSSRPIKFASTAPAFGVRITIEGPDGQRVTPYPYYPFSGSGKFKIGVIRPGENGEFEIDLGALFPFMTAGIYRCVLTKRSFAEGDALVPFAPDALRGAPIDVTSAPFQLRIESPSVATLRSMTDSRTGRSPREVLDGISVVQWYDDPTKEAKLSAEYSAEAVEHSPASSLSTKANDVAAPVESRHETVESRPTTRTYWQWVWVVIAIFLLLFSLRKKLRAR